MARSSGGSAGAIVAGLTAAALAVVAFFAFQASAAADRAADASDDKPRATAPASPSATPDETKKRETALPADSGTGQRVVYALERKRVWLVDAGEKVQRTFRVWPSSVSPQPGQYAVTSRSAHVTGSDGEPVENVVRFASVGETGIGFSAALDGSKPVVDPAKKTGGIRETRKDGKAMWLFAVLGTKVVVVP